LVRRLQVALNRPAELVVKKRKARAKGTSFNTYPFAFSTFV